MIGLLNQRIVLYALAALILALVAIVSYNRIKKVGYEQCKVEYKTAQETAFVEAQEKIKDAELKYDKIRREVRNAKTTSHCVGDNVSNVLNRL